MAKVICPTCHTEIDVAMTVAKLKCKRCDHEWIRREEELPVVCPHCKSPYWSKDRIRSRLTQVGGRKGEKSNGLVAKEKKGEGKDV